MNATTKNSTPDTPAIHHRRRRHFIDASLQGRLLVALIGLEILLFSGAMIWLYLDLSAIIDANLYRVHYTDSDGVSPFLGTLFTVIPVILVVNLLALWLADVLWRAYVNRIVNRLRHMLERIGRLDLREQAQDAQVRHEVIDRARAWLASERQEFADIGQLVERLPDSLDPRDDKEVTRVKIVLRELQTLFD